MYYVSLYIYLGKLIPIPILENNCIPTQTHIKCADDIPALFVIRISYHPDATKSFKSFISNVAHTLVVMGTRPPSFFYKLKRDSGIEIDNIPIPFFTFSCQK